MLTEEEKNEIIKLLTSDQPLPEKYRTRLFSFRGVRTERNASGHMVELHCPASVHGQSPNDDAWLNSIFWGDNLDVLLFLKSGEMSRRLAKAGGIKLIYIDPPFNAAMNFRLHCPDDFPAHPPFAFQDIWERGLDGYLEWLKPRLWLMRGLLADDGAIFVHCDSRVNSRLRLLLDDIFHFHVNELVWHYTGGGRSKSRFSRKHDSIFIYSRSPRFNFYPDQIRVPYSPTSSYAKSGIRARSGKKYMPHPLGLVPDDVWDIPIINPLSRERNGYPTQKPEALLERIILSCTRTGDLVADFFCGSGVSAVVAEKLNRKWLLADIGLPAIHLTRKRLLHLNETRKESAAAPSTFSIWTVNAGESRLSHAFSPAPCSSQKKSGQLRLMRDSGSLYLIFPRHGVAKWEIIKAHLETEMDRPKNVFVLASAYAGDSLEKCEGRSIWRESEINLLNLPLFLNPNLPLRLQCGPALFPRFKIHRRDGCLALELLNLRWGADYLNNGLVSGKNGYEKDGVKNGERPEWEKLLDCWAIDTAFALAFPQGEIQRPAFQPAWHSGENGATRLLSPFLPYRQAFPLAVKITDIFFNESLILLEI